jgi:hypothetical protein
VRAKCVDAAGLGGRGPRIREEATDDWDDTVAVERFTRIRAAGSSVVAPP